ncbi:hypothetical protein Tco_0381902 [Tanacetum coccineum]
MVPRAVLMKSDLVPLSTARQVNNAHPKITMNSTRPMANLSKSAHSTVKWPIHKNTTFKNSNFNQRVNTVKDKNVNAARPKAVVNTARPKAVVNVVQGNNVNAVKASACWVWKPKTKVLDHGNPQMDLQDQGVIDSGCSRHMTGNMSYLTDYEEIDGGYVAFGGNPKGGKITRKGTKACDDAGKARMETVPGKNYIMLPLWTADPPFSQSSKIYPDAVFKSSSDDGKKVDEDLRKEVKLIQICLACEDIVYSYDDEDVGAKTDMNNLDAFMPVSPILTTRVHKDHPVEQIIRDLNSAPQTKRMTKNLEEHEPKKVIHALKDPSWIEAMQEELLQFKLQEVWTLVELHNGKNDSPEHINKNKTFKNNQRVNTVRGKEVNTVRPKAVVNAARPKAVVNAVKGNSVNVVKASACWVWKPKTKVLDHGNPQVDLQDQGVIDSGCSSQDKYVTKILKKFGFTDVKTASTPMETQKPLLKDADGEEVDVHLYRSMIGSLMYLTSSKPDIMFAVCACARYQVNPKVSHLHAVKRIFRYLKGQPKLGLWYPKDSPFDLVAYNDSDYAGAGLDRKSTIGGCQFLGCRLISWQCKKQTVVANSITEDEYVAASIKNPVFHSKTKHIEIRHHFIKYSNEKKLVQMIKIHTDKNVVDLLTKAFDTPTITQPSSSQPQKKQIPRKPSRKNTEVPQPSGSPDIVADEAINEEMDDSLVRAAITASSIEAEQDSGNINKSQYKTTPNEPSSLGTSSGGGPKRQQIMGDSSTQTRFKRVSKLSNDPLLLRGNTLRSGEDSLKLQELMELCTNLQQRVLDLEQTNTTQALEIDSLKRRVKKLKKKQRLRAYRLKRLYKFALSRRVESSDEEGLGEEDASKQGRISDIDADAGISLVSTHFYTDTDMFGVHDLVGDESVVEEVTAAATTVSTASTILVSAAATTTTTVITDVEITLAQALADLKSAKPKVDKVVIQEPEQGTTTPTLTTTTAATTITAASTRPRAKGLDKGKGKMVEPKPMKKMSKKELLRLDEELAFKLQAEEEEEERLAREKAQHIKEANIAWDDV